MYQAVIGKSNTFPFFSDGNNDIFVFNGNDIISADFVCSGCSEPIEQELELCAWCRITERHEQTAAMANPFRIMQHYGILDGYFDDVAKIERSRD